MYWPEIIFFLCKCIIIFLRYDDVDDKDDNDEHDLLQQMQKNKIVNTSYMYFNETW